MILVCNPVSNQPVKHITAVQCMTANLYFESRNQSIRGMKAVAAVTYNRSVAKAFPSDFCSVVFQSKQFSWTHQESYATILKILDGDLTGLSKKDQISYKKALDIALLDPLEYVSVLPKNTTFYHAIYIKPKWSKYKVKVAKIDQHVFYK